MALTYNLTFDPSPGSYGTLVEYRKSTESTWTTPTNEANPTSFNHFTLILDEGSTYYIRLSANGGNCTKKYKIITLATSSSLVWVEDESYCEETTPLNSVDSITGFADPQNIGYDTVSGRMYVADLSAVTSGSNVYWFDPNTITDASDVTPVGSINKSVHNSIMDMDNRRIYLSGSNTGGLMRYDIATNTASTLTCGTDVAWPNYNRLSLLKADNSILLVDAAAAKVFIINALTFTISNSISFTSIPSYTQYFSKGSIILRINGEWWVLASQDSNLGSNGSGIARYNNDFSVLIGVINLPGQILWTNSAYWRSAKEINNKLYITDAGSNQLLSVDLNTLLVTPLYTFTNRQGKSHAALQVIVDPITQDIFIVGDFRNDVNTDGSPIPISYKLDPVTFQPSYIYPSISFGTGYLIRQGLTTKIFGTYIGLTVYSQINPSVAPTDGAINIFDKSGGGNYTGYRIVTSLKQEDNGDPTGLTKANVQGDPDYIPKYIDVSGCAISYDMVCPTATYTQTGTTVEYEYSLKPSTAQNPSVDHIVLQQIDETIPSVVANTSVPKNTYQHGTLVRVGANPNRVDLLFKDSSNNTLATCTNIFTIS